MRTFKLTLTYDGAAYCGWQAQPGKPTVQGALETALEKITGQGVRTVGSGRTDAGVHALGQVVSFAAETRLSTDVLCRALNAELPHDMAVIEVSEAGAGFHAVRDARRKRYRYVIHDGPVRDVFFRRYCWPYRHGRLDADAMHRAAQTLVGTHDFRSFQTAGSERHSTIRTVFQIAVNRGAGGQNVWPAAAGQGRAGGADYVLVEVEGDGFLYNMVRVIVGTLVEVGRGARPENWLAEVLQASDRRAAGRTAPPQGLFLLRVAYAVAEDRGPSYTG